jgi:hypothetical protein
MSWSSREPRSHLGGAAAALLLSALASGPCLAAEVYVQPIVKLQATSNTNLELTPPPEQRLSGAGYFADVATVIGITSPTSTTTVKPRLVYNYYPSASEIDQLEAYLDFSTQFTWPRDRLLVYGRYEHVTDLHAETPGAAFNPVTPGLPTAPTSGQISFGATVDQVILVPTWQHNLTPLTNLLVSGVYQYMNFTPSDTVSHVDFDYGLVRAAFGWNQTPRTSWNFGVFGSTYQARNIDAHADTYGPQVEFHHEWSPLWNSTLTLLYQRSNLVGKSPLQYDVTANEWGFNFDTGYKTQLDQLRLILSRTLTPSAAGSLFETDEARLQYERDFTERLSATGAVRYFRTRDVGGVVTANTRDYATTTVSVAWMITPQTYVQAGYTYTWQKYQLDTASADNSSFLIEVGYRGLPPQR